MHFVRAAGIWGGERACAVLLTASRWETMELRDYLNVLRVRKWVIIQAVVIVTLAALVVSFLQPKSYQGTVEVLVSEKDTSAAILGTVLPALSEQPERAMQTQVELMQIRPIAEATIQKLNLQMTPDVLISRVTVAAVGQTDLVRITATDTTPDLAAKIANTLADEYVISERNAQRESIAEAAAEVQKRLDTAKQEIIALGRKIAATPNPSQDLSAELQIATGTYTTLAEKFEQLRINERLETGPARVVSTAVTDTRAVAPQPMRNAAFGLVVGLLFGVGMAFFYEYLDNTIKSTVEIEKILGSPVLGTIPMDKFEKGQKRRLAIVDAPGSSTAEAYRVLRNSLDFINFQHDLKTLIVTSAAPGEGKSTVASNLAAALAQAGKKVVLVSVDFRRPTTDQFFAVNNMIGLSDVLLGTHSLKGALQRPGDEQLLVLSAGKMPPNPSELLGSEKMAEVIKSLGEWGEWIIIDTPPLLAVADPAAVARWVDGVLMVSQAGVSTRDAGRKALELLQKVGARIIGVVVWGLDESRGSGYGYGYGHYSSGYYYASYYSQQPFEAPRAKKSSSKGSDDAPESAEPAEWVRHESSGRRFGRAVGALLKGFVAFVLVVVVLLLVVLVLSQYFGWGVAGLVHLPGGLRF